MMLRLLHVITGLGLGGAEAMLHKLLSRTEGAGVSSNVISLSSADAFESRIAALGVPVHRLGIESLTSVPKGFARLLTLTRQTGPQVIQGWMPHGNLAALVARYAGCRKAHLIWGVRQSIYALKHEAPNTARLIRLAARLSGYAEAIIYNSETARAHHEALGYRKDRGTVIPNGFDVNAFAPSLGASVTVRRELGATEDARLVGLVGRFHPMKDHRSFIKAASIVVRKHPECRFVMVGPGVDWGNSELAEALRIAGLAGSAHLLGVRHDLPKILAGLDVVVSSSYTEAFPNAIGEAMSCGVPCVVTDVGESARLVGETGVVVPSRNPEVLASGVNRLLDLSREERQALGAKARARVVARYSLDDVARTFAALYSSLSK